ncbi:hypothetical protein ACS0TY_024241 [Phlomoides rotata]
MAQDTGMFTVPQTIGSVLCCKCGILMQPNAANMCVKCLRSEVDITKGLQKHVIIIHCPECNKFLQPPRTWMDAELESKGLLTFCVKRIQANPDQWIAAVQLRQHVSHRRTFFYLEQLILKHDAAKNAIRIKQMDQGIDFFFGLALLSSRQLMEFIVLDIEPVSSEVNVGGLKYVLADAQVARVSDFGKKDTIFNIRTHLGHLLNPGDFAFGYDLFGANSNDVELDKYKGFNLPDVILIKKSYEETGQASFVEAQVYQHGD